MGDSVKSLAEVEVDSIHGSPFIYLYPLIYLYHENVLLNTILSAGMGKKRTKGRQISLHTTYRQ